jgi:hypothetical protein
MHVVASQVERGVSELVTVVHNSFIVHEDLHNFVVSYFARVVQWGLALTVAAVDFSEELNQSFDNINVAD